MEDDWGAEQKQSVSSRIGWLAIRLFGTLILASVLFVTLVTSLLPVPWGVISSVSSISPATDSGPMSAPDWAQLVFNAPKEVQRDQQFELEVLLSSKISRADLQAMLVADQRKTSLITGVGEVEDGVRFSSWMKATLDGVGFEITQSGSEERRVFDELPAKWVWTILPVREGRRVLHLVVRAIIDGKDAVVLMRPIELEVKTTAGAAFERFVHDNWKELIAAIGSLGVAGFLTRAIELLVAKKKRIRVRERRKAPVSDPAEIRLVAALSKRGGASGSNVN